VNYKKWCSRPYLSALYCCKRECKIVTLLPSSLTVCLYVQCPICMITSRKRNMLLTSGSGESPCCSHLSTGDDISLSQTPGNLYQKKKNSMNTISGLEALCVYVQCFIDFLSSLDLPWIHVEHSCSQFKMVDLTAWLIVVVIVVAVWFPPPPHYLFNDGCVLFLLNLLILFHYFLFPILGGGVTVILQKCLFLWAGVSFTEPWLKVSDHTLININFFFISATHVWIVVPIMLSSWTWNVKCVGSRDS